MKEVKSNLYSADDLCNIIKSCSKNSVSSLKVGYIELNFTTNASIEAKMKDSWAKPIAPVTYKTNNKSGASTLKPLDLTPTDMEEIEELERAQQAIDDPVGFEEAIINDFVNEEAANEANGYS